MQPYNRRFNSRDEAKEYFEGIGKLTFFGTEGDYHIYNLMHKGWGYHLNLYKDGRVTYKEMSSIVYHYWKNQE